MHPVEYFVNVWPNTSPPPKKQLLLSMESAQVFKMLTGLVRGVHLIARTAYGLNLYWFNLVRYPLHHKNFLCPYRNHVPMQFLKARAYGVGRANMICLLSFDLII